MKIEIKIVSCQLPKSLAWLASTKRRPSLFLVFTPCDGTFSKRFKFKKCPSSSHQTYFSVMKEGVQASDFCHNFFSFTAQKQCTARLVGEVKGVVYDSVEAQQPRFRDQACLLYHFIAISLGFTALPGLP